LRCVELNAKTHARVVAPHVGPGTSAHLLFSLAHPHHNQKLIDRDSYLARDATREGSCSASFF